ncbi:MAG: LysR family transcriptional regulator [Acidobacteriota bacterium]
MELRQIHTFVAVAELRHFARAADRCNLSQPAVSHQIRLLEEELGARLFNRTRRRVSLTVAGEVFLDDARRILADVDRARERVHGAAAGTLGRVRLGATETAGLYLLPAILDRFRAEHPQFVLQFDIGSEPEIVERVAANDLDLGVLIGKPVLGELRARRMGSDDLLIVSHPRSALAGAGERRPVDLVGECWILREDGSDTRRQLDAWFRRHRLTPARTMTLQGPDAVKRAVGAGLGIALLARTVVSEELKRGRLAPIAARGLPIARDVLLVDHPRKHHGAACQAMIRLLTTRE